MWRPASMIIRDPGSPQMDLDSAVSGVFQGILLSQNSREQEETIKQLTTIHDRVKAALAHFGMNTNVKATQSEIAEEHARRHRPPGFLTKQKREEMLHKQNILDTLHEFIQVSIRKETLMDDVGDWLFDVKTTLEKNVLSEDDMKEKIREEVEMERNAYQSLNEAKRSTKKIAEKFRSLGREMFETMNEMAREQDTGDDLDEEGGIDQSANQDNITQRMFALKAKQQNNQEPLNEKAMAADLANWKAAASEVKKALDDALRMARTNNDRNGIKNSMKQFNFMCAVTDRRNKENMILSEEILEVEVKGNSLQKMIEKTELELKKKSTRLTSLEAHVEKQNAKMADLRKSLKEAIEQGKKCKTPDNTGIEAAVKAASVAAKTFAEEKAKLISEMDALKTQMVAKEAEMQKKLDGLQAEGMDSQDTSDKLNRVVENLSMQLEDARDKIDEYEHRLEISSTQNEAKQSRQESVREQYKERLKEYKKEVEAFEVEVSRLKEENMNQEDTIHMQENKISDLTAQVKQQSSAMQQMKDIPVPTGSPAEFRHMLTRVKGDYEQEIHRLKDFFGKEKQRNDAKLRRQEQEMKNTLASVYKETSHLLRAQNRFKENMAVLVEREGLLDTGHEIRQMHNLVVEEKPTDPRMILSQLAGNAVELLVALESKIAQAFMNKRLEIKEALTATKQRNMTPVAEIDADVEKLTKENEALNDKLQKAHEQIQAAEMILSETKRINEESYKSLLERHKALILRSTGLQRELKNVEQAFREEIKKRDNRMRSIKGSMNEQSKQQQNLISQLKMDLTSGQNSAPPPPPNYEKMRIKVGEQMQNLKMLEEALKENKISLELHTITVDIINQAIEVPEMRLQHLFERYILFRRLKEQKDSLIDKIDESGLRKGKEKRLEGFFLRMETRMQDSIKKWQDKREELKIERTKLYEQMGDIFDVVTQEAGIIMHKPKDRTVTIVRSTPKGRRPTLASQGVRVTVPTKPGPVTGHSMHLIGEQGPYWHMPPSNWEGISLVTCPRMLQFDVDARRIAAKQVLQRLGVGDASCRRQTTRTSQTPSVPPLATLFPPISK